MARTGFLHHIGTFFFLAAAILLLVVSISAPVIKDIAILKVSLTNKTTIRNSSVTFGTFGHCILDVPPVQTDQDYCFPKVVGYDVASIMEEIDHTSFSKASRDSANRLTNVMVLHPVACVIAFIAFLVSIGATVIGSILASLIGALAWIITLIVMAIDFSIFGIVKNHVNKDGSGSHASYSVGMWLVLAAMILLFFAMFIVLFTCCSARRQKRRSYPADTAYTTEKRSRRRYFGRNF